ncbi:MAG: type II toxin-antitoxin system PemK/MazF family toxin [Planctomycetota bacterium]|nr:type II toxin-antitoxin system PemK/MazF family toxin [Planctomycetota bacterium]
MTAPLEIHLARLRVRRCQDLRPCVVVAVLPANRVLVAPISSSDLYRPPQDFMLDSASSEFGDTGLDRSSFVLGDEWAEIDAGRLEDYLGRLTGDLAQAFLEWLG